MILWIPEGGEIVPTSTVKCKSPVIVQQSSLHRGNSLLLRTFAFVKFSSHTFYSLRSSIARRGIDSWNPLLPRETTGADTMKQSQGLFRLLREITFAVTVAIFCLQNTFAQVEPLVPVTHPVYEFLTHLEARGVIPSFRTGSLPLTDAVVRRALEVAAREQTRLNATEQRLLFRYSAEFSPGEPTSLKGVFVGERPLMQVLDTVFSRMPNAPRTHTAWYNDGTHSFYLELAADARAGFRTSDERTSRRRLLGGELKLYGKLGEHLAYFGQTYRAALFGDVQYASSYPLIRGGTLIYDASGGRPFFNDSRGYLAYRTSLLHLLVGKEAFQIGYGRSGKLVLSDNARPFGLIQFQINGDWFTYSYLHGALNSEKRVEKFLALQRFDFTPASWFDIAISEMVIYSQRGIDLNYLSPLQYYRSISHNLGDTDNSLLAIDARVRPFNGLQLYSNWLIDDFSFTYLFRSHGINKFGFLLGFQLAMPSWSIWTEYVAIYPWVYSHRSLYNEYTNNGRILGYSTGPNSDVWYLEVQRWWSERLRTSLSVQQRRHGANPPGVNIGGDVFNGVEQNIGTRDFLGGILQTTRAVTLTSLYELFNEWYVQFQYQFERADGSSTHQFDVGFWISL